MQNHSALLQLTDDEMLRLVHHLAVFDALFWLIDYANRTDIDQTDTERKHAEQAHFDQVVSVLSARLGQATMYTRSLSDAQKVHLAQNFARSHIHKRLVMLIQPFRSLNLL